MLWPAWYPDHNLDAGVFEPDQIQPLREAQVAVLVYSVKLNHTSGGRDPEFNLQVGDVRKDRRRMQRHQVVTFVFDFAVIATRERTGVPDSRCELLAKVNVAEPDVLCLQATQRIEGILSAPPDQGLAAADARPRDPEVSKKSLYHPGRRSKRWLNSSIC